MDADDMNYLKDKILARYFEEESKPVRTAIAVLIGNICKVSYLNNQQWKEVIVMISEKTGKGNHQNVRI